MNGVRACELLVRRAHVATGCIARVACERSTLPRGFARELSVRRTLVRPRTLVIEGGDRAALPATNRTSVPRSRRPSAPAGAKSVYDGPHHRWPRGNCQAIIRQPSCAVSRRGGDALRDGWAKPANDQENDLGLPFSASPARVTEAIAVMAIHPQFAHSESESSHGNWP